MRETLLLIFDSISISNRISKDMFVHDVIEQRIEFQMEDMCYQIRLISWCLMGQEGLSDFSPMGICSERDEQIRATKFA